MLDLFFLVEMTLCMVVMATEGLSGVLLYAGGLVSSAYIAWQSANWTVHTLLDHNIAVLTWVATQITKDSSTLAVLSPFLPAESVVTGEGLELGIAYQVLHTITFSAIIGAVFTLFIVTSKLVDALWDKIQSPLNTGESVFIFGISAIAGLYVVTVSGLLLANLASLEQFAPLAELVHHSLIEHGLALTVTWLHTH